MPRIAKRLKREVSSSDDSDDDDDQYLKHVTKKSTSYVGESQEDIKLPSSDSLYDFFESLFSAFTEIEKKYKALRKREWEVLTGTRLQLKETDIFPIIEQDGPNKRLKMIFDVRGFRPDEIVVNTDDHVVRVYARHDLKSGKNKSFREFSREIVLPKGVRTDTLHVSLRDDGTLMVEGIIPPIKGKRKLK